MKSVCPICQKQLASDERSEPFPFCSSRCKKLDLYRWLNEVYRFTEPLKSDLVPGTDSDTDVDKGGAPG